MRAEIAETRAGVSELQAETRAGVSELRAETRAEASRLRADMRAGFTAVDAKFDQVNAELRSIKDQLAS